MPGVDDIKRLIDDHDEQVDDALEKAGGAAAARFGHEEQIDKAVEAAQEHTGSGNTNADDR
jgi:hypothetical protein